MKKLDGKTFAAIVNNGFKALKMKYQEINDLNVFPVPDGDTGTNMTSTISGGIAAIEKGPFDNLGDVAARAGNGMLLSARGNSGVIVSQFFAGIAEGLQGLEKANVIQFVAALQAGTRKAYEAVVKPVEGTILTVARESTDFVTRKSTTIKDFETLFEILSEQMLLSLKRTPELLPVLKEAGVIDSGGAGLLTIIQGMCSKINGEDVQDVDFNGPTSSLSGQTEVAFNEDSVLEYGYCTEFILQLLNSKDGPSKFNLQSLIDYLGTLGDSIVAVRSGNVVKVHVHTKTPSKVLEYAQQYGEFITWKMENMSIQHNEVLLKEEEETKPEMKLPIAIVTVAPSNEIGELFTRMGANYIVSGGQTMNPSAQDFLNAFKGLSAEKIIVFPNNGNIILTAKQAASMAEGLDITVIESKSLIQCYSALSMIDVENQSFEQNLANIEVAIRNVIACSVCQACRESVNNGFNIKEGDFMGLVNGEINAVGSTIMECMERMLEGIPSIEEKSMVTAFYGIDATDEDKTSLNALISSKYPLMDIVEIEGKQTIYPFILAIE